MPKSNKDLDTLLEEIQVGQVDDYHNQVNKSGLTALNNGHWWHVSDNDGVRAYFNNEGDALAFRLFLVNAALNPLKVAK